ncbi:MAG: hypothetical protein AAGJ08_24085 [Cyanobacteria bacterium P01_H01_bin.35]
MIIYSAFQLSRQLNPLLGVRSQELGVIAIPAYVAGNQKVNKKVETPTCCLLPVKCSLKSSKILAMNILEDCYS